MFLATRILAAVLTMGVDAPDRPIMLEFSAEWCGPCRQTRPHVQELKRKGFPIREIDVDEDAEGLAERFGVTSVPTFVVVERNGRELDRMTGASEASQLAAFYERAAKLASRGGDSSAAQPRVATDSNGRRPNPMETVVRIKVKITQPRMAVGYGSGTIIYSDDDESIILTCAHIFKIEGQRKQYAPGRFPFPVEVDVFDGKPSAEQTPRVGVSEADIPAQVIDYDFVGDVALIRIKPGHRLPASPVVPPGWTPATGLKMTTVGCSQGQDATAWSTQVTRPQLVLQKDENATYEATECLYAPIQGRSGGGLFTLDGLLAGVCDFNDAPRGNGAVHRSPKYHGLYASPRTIHRLLDKHKLQICYATMDGQGDGRLMASRGAEGVRLGRIEPDKLRGQSPEPYPIPSPEVMGVRMDEVAERSSEARKFVKKDMDTRGRWRAVSESDEVDAGEGSGQVVSRREAPPVELFDDAALQATERDKPVKPRRTDSAWSAAGDEAE